MLLVTNGEVGFKYASLAEPIYAAELTRESVGRVAAATTAVAVRGMVKDDLIKQVPDSAGFVTTSIE